MDQLSSRIADLSPQKRALLQLRLRQKAATAGSEPAIKPRTDRNSARASFAQQRLWFLEQLEPGQAAYNVPRAMRLDGPLNIQALRNTLAELVRRHEPFRTHFLNVDGELRQIIRDDLNIPLTEIDLTSLSKAEREAEALRLAKEEAARPFDLNHGPVIRTSLLRLDEQQHILLLTMHHIVSDAWSTVILFREFEQLYESFANGNSASLPPLAIQYADFAEWQRDWLQGGALAEQLSYWKRQLAGVTTGTALPADYPLPTTPTFQGTSKWLALSPDLSRKLTDLSKREGATLFMTLLAAFKTLLYRFTSQEDIVVGSPIAGRNRAELEDLIGFFINTLALRTSLSGNPTFRELLQRVKQTAIDAYTHQDLPFETLVAELDPVRDLRRNPLFQVMFQYKDARAPLFQSTNLDVTWLETSTQTAKFDLTMAVLAEDEVLNCVIEYRNELFRDDTIERFLSHYAILLENIVADPNENIATLPLLTEAQRNEIIAAGRGELSDFPREQTIQELFEQQVERTPDDVALIFGDERLSFHELNVRANQLAHYLRARGVGLEVRVAIRMQRSPEMIVGLLGILKAGGAYVPLDPANPEERALFILEDSGAALVLTKEPLQLASRVPVVSLDEISRAGESNPPIATTAANAAHVIYTSGSTGRPKGVISTHRASVNRFAWMWRAYPFQPGEVCCQKTALSFVDSIWEIFGPLLQGVPLVILDDDTVKDPARFITALSNARVTRLVLVPSLLRVMLESDDDLAERLQHLRFCVCSGEGLPVELAAAFRARLPHTELINLYGSSEVAADVTCYEVTDINGLHSIPIGKPISNTQIYILDAHLQPAPFGVIGELYIGGEGLARGYLNQPALTEEKFVADPFSGGDTKLFRTGDLGRFLADGNIEFHGRRDHQVKVRGVRIELGEIESVLKTNPAIRQAVVVPVDDAQGGKQLVVYLVADVNPPAMNELRSFLRRKLPDYMVPSAFVVLESLPLNASGKIDRLALPAPDQNQAETNFVAPRTPVEEVLATIWAKTLGRDRVGVNDDFFSLGGHSLLVAKIVARVSEALHVELPMRTLFEAPTVAALATEVEKLQQISGGPAANPLARVPRDGPLPLSFAQERLWFFDQLEPDSGAYNIPRALRLKGQLDKEALQRSFNRLVERHEVLRTSFINDHGKPGVSIQESAGFELKHLDLRHLPEAKREEESQTIAAEEVKRPFDLKHAPLLRVVLAQLDDDDHLLLLTIHHIISDGWSIGILLSELAAVYNNLSLPDLPVQYVDFAAWQRRSLSDESLKRQIDYWTDRLSGAPASINLPSDRTRPSVRKFSGAKHPLKFTKEISESLKSLGRENRATLFMTLLTAFQTLLACITGDDDIVVGSPILGRNRSETQNLIGNFVNTIVQRAKFSGDPDFREMLQQVRDAAIEAFTNQDVPFEKLVEKLQPARTLSHNPLFQVWFVLQNPEAERQEFAGLTTESLNVESAVVRHDLQLTLWETGDGLKGFLSYSSELFESETIAQIAKQFESLLATITAKPETRLSDLRALLATVASDQLEESSRRKLKSVRRKTVAGGQLIRESGTLPLLVQPSVDGLRLVDWATTNREQIEQKLLRYGAILFRGFEVNTVAEFEEFMKSLAGDLLDYSYRSTPRTQVSGKIYTSTEYPAHQTIPLHNEMSYTRRWPMMLGFFCMHAAEYGGETPIADSRKVFQRIDSSIRDRFSRRGVRYVRHYGDALDLTWQNVFQTENRAEAEEFCREAGIDFEWKGDERLCTSEVCQATAAHPRTGEMVWFNQAHLFHVSSLESEIRDLLLSGGEPPRNAFYGDGTPIDNSDLEEIRAAYEKETVVFPWHKRDVLLVDNMLTAHGRKPYRGARQIVVGMGRPSQAS
jgi:amino acid adenylation domain-containing protein